MHMAILWLGCLSLQEIAIAQPRNLTKYDMKGHEKLLKQHSNSGVDHVLYQHHKDNQRESYDAKGNAGRRIFRRKMHGGRLFGHSFRYAVNQLLSSVKDAAVTVAKTAGGVAEAIVLTPLVGLEKTINAEHYLHALGKDMSKRVAHGVKQMIGKSWEAFETVQLPGWNVVMFFPRGLISIVNKTTNTVWFLTSKARKAIAPVKAYAIYAAVHAITAVLGTVMRITGLDCIKMPAHNYKFDNPMVDELQTSTGRICGISNIRAGENVTVSRDDESFLMISVPFEISDLSVSFSAITISGFTGILIKNAPMEVTMKNVEISGTLSFTAGTLIRFLSVHLHVDDMDGFNIRFPKENNESDLMELVASFGQNLSPMLVDAINKKLDQFENRIINHIRSMLGQNPV